jgi:4-diphosphocytidyl-2-C-methyl-D-erythritol kinase
MRSLLDVPAPAKLNLFLHLVGRREDGYHLLESAFVLIDWCDTLHFELRADGGLSREDLTVPLPAEDLVLRAARALRRHTGTTLGAHIGVEKRVPAQAGMGGGSSDAASCLLALNRLWNLGLDGPALEAIGLGLGADVPFFLRGRNAWVEGIGERITPLAGAAAPPPAGFVVVKPQAGLDTRMIFSSPDLKRDSPGARIAVFAADHYGFGHNDLQPVAETLCPEISQAIDWLGSQGLQARMTGSGSAVFAVDGNVGIGNRMPLSAPGADPAWQVRRCSSLDIHPLAGWLQGRD